MLRPFSFLTPCVRSPIPIHTHTHTCILRHPGVSLALLQWPFPEFLPRNPALKLQTFPFLTAESLPLLVLGTSSCCPVPAPSEQHLV